MCVKKKDIERKWERREGKIEKPYEKGDLEELWGRTEIAKNKAIKMCQRGESNFRRQNGYVSSFAKSVYAINYPVLFRL